jgi:CcmD family protein
MPEGVIVGGWSYVVAAYSITAVGLAAFVWSLVRRLRKLEED